MDNKIWEFVSQDEGLKLHLARKLEISPFLASLLINRGVHDFAAANAFLYPDWKNLSDPFYLPGMEEAVLRIKEALQKKERILIYGDYDADGVLATALLALFFRRLGVSVETYLPHRLGEGYGLHFSPLYAAKKRGVDLVISVDCGTASGSVVKKASEIGLDIIITDHHLITEEVPEKVPLVNPHLGWKENLKSLSGVGVAFQLVRAISILMARKGLIPFAEETNSEYLDLVATGSIADLSPLWGESRTFVCLGLKVLRRAERPAFRALFDQAGLMNPNLQVDLETISYIIGPRINAAGRVSSADLSLQLFLSENEKERQEFAKRLEENNRQRQSMEKKILEEALGEIEEKNLAEKPVIILKKSSWHPGVVGIVAGKISERFHRPTIIFAVNPHLAKGSGRSTPNFNLFEAVKSCRKFLSNFGGHQKAVGVSILPANLEDFQRAMEDYAEKKFKVEDFQERIKVESLFDLSELTPGVAKEVGMMAPFGEGNPAPVLASLGLEVQKYSKIFGNNHLKLWLRKGRTFRQAIGYGMAHLQPFLPAGLMVDVAYTPHLSTEEEVSRIELEIKSLRESV